MRWVEGEKNAGNEARQWLTNWHWADGILDVRAVHLMKFIQHGSTKREVLSLACRQSSLQEHAKSCAAVCDLCDAHHNSKQTAFHSLTGNEAHLSRRRSLEDKGKVRVSRELLAAKKHRPFQRHVPR